MSVSKAKKKKHSTILWVAYIALVCYCIISLVGLRMDVKESERNVANIEAQVEAKKAENKKLNDILEDPDMDSYVEKIAHDELGYVFPDERVYYDQQLADK